MIPWATPSVLVALMWIWILDPNHGILNKILLGLGLIKEPLELLSRPESALPTLVAVDVWQGIPLFAVMILAALQGVSPEQREAAAVDGAGRWATFWAVVWPVILPTVLITTLLRLIWTSNYVDPGPHHDHGWSWHLFHHVGAGVVLDCIQVGRLRAGCRLCRDAGDNLVHLHRHLPPSDQGRREHEMRKKQTTPVQVLGRVGLYVALFGWLGAILAPYVIMLLTSVTPQAELQTAGASLLPKAITLDAYRDLCDWYRLPDVPAQQPRRGRHRGAAHADGGHGCGDRAVTLRLPRQEVRR